MVIIPSKYISTLIALLFTTLATTQCSDTVQYLSDHFALYPEADTDGDGLLCQEEYVDHLAFLYKIQTLEMLEGQVTCQSDIEYARVGDTSLILDLWLPAELDEENLPPLIVWLHGGGWRSGDKDECRLAWLAAHNFAIASVEFRSVGDIAFPANVHDIKGAVRWLRKEQQNYSFDATRVGIGGTSSGGHLAALLGTSGDVAELEGEVGGNLNYSSRVQAAFDVAGVIDILTWRNPPAVLTAALGITNTSAEGVEALIELSNPATHISQDDPPFLIYHGSTDNVVDVAQAEDFHDTLLISGIESQLQILDVGHLSPLFFNGERADTIVAFFSRALKGTDNTSLAPELIKDSGYIIMPSLVHDAFVISKLATDAKVAIFNYEGQLIKNFGNKNTSIFDISELNSGLYLLRIELPGSKPEILKLIKN